MAFNGDEPAPEPLSGSPSRSTSISLQAAATMNAGLQRETSPLSTSSSLSRQNRAPSSSSRRRSTVLMNLQLNDPAVPAPGEMINDGAAPQRASFSSSAHTADPNHHRAPSLGELHQELEAEQESHVNRLLQTIRQQQLELLRLQAGQTASAEDSSAINERTGQPVSSSQNSAASVALAGSYARSPGLHHPRGSMDMTRIDLQHRSRTPSRGASPRLRSTSRSAESGDWVLGGRDESAFYQAETQMLVRENQMLRHRIRELEKQLGESSGAAPLATEPAVPSLLSQSSTTVEEEDGGATKSRQPEA